MHTLVLAGGDLPSGPLRLEPHDLVIAADSGIDAAALLGLTVDLLIGDLDSATAESVAHARAAGVEVVEHPPDKDATDLELAIDEAVARGATQLTVVAPFGGRLDHELGTIGLLASPRLMHLVVRGDDGVRTLHVVRDRVDLDETVGTTISAVPWNGDAIGVTTTGLRWPLRAETLPLGTTRGVSNVAAVAEQQIALDEGTLLVIVDRSASS